jgi:long-chain acyl-CoA synthetase
MGESPITLGKLIKSARLEAGLTQDNLATRVGVTSRYIMAIENENKYPSIQVLSSVIHRPCRIIASDEVKCTVGGLYFVLNGVVWVSRRDKEQRQAAKGKCIELLQNGSSLLIFPEGIWNVSKELPMLPISWGVIEMAQRTSAPIVPMALEYNHENCWAVFGSPRYIFPEQSKEEECEKLRDEMATLRWKMWERFNCCSRGKISEEDYWEYSARRADECKGMTIEEINALAIKRHATYEDAFSPIDRLEPSTGNAFLFQRRNICTYPMTKQTGRITRHCINEQADLSIGEKMTLHGKNTGFPSVDQTHLHDISRGKRNPFIPDCSIYKAIRLTSMHYRRSAAVDCLKVKLSYAELLGAADQTAKAMCFWGVKPGDIVAAALPNYWQAVVIFLAANKIGAVTSFLNHYAAADEIVGYLKLFDSPLYFGCDENQEHYERILAQTKVRHCVTLAADEIGKRFAELRAPFSDAAIIPFSVLPAVSEKWNGKTPGRFGSKQDAMILFTSGTTGNPKSVVLTNENILASAIFLKNTSNTKAKPGEKCLVCVPFCYPYGFATSTLTSLFCGWEAILAPELSAGNIDGFLAKQPNIIFGSPALLELVMRNAAPDRGLSSVHSFISGGDFLTPAQKEKGEAFFRRHGAAVDISNGSGNAETVGASTISFGGEIKPTTVGRVLFGNDAVTLDPESGREMKYGEEGELCIAGRNVFREYYREPELTRQAKIEFKGKTYFRTGTRGSLDEEGYFTLTGREARYYIMSTLNKIYCDHVQLILGAIDCAASCADVPLPDDKLLFTNCAFFVLKDGWPQNDATKALIIEECRKPQRAPGGEQMQLKPYEIPARIEFLDRLPRNAADKVDYRLLEETAAMKERVKMGKKD